MHNKYSRILKTYTVKNAKYSNTFHCALRPLLPSKGPFIIIKNILETKK